MTLASRITGFIRDTLLAILFGAGLSMDAFVVAFRIPNLLRRLFAEGASPRPSCPFSANTARAAAMRPRASWPARCSRFSPRRFSSRRSSA
jgi:hypothetical protein